MQDENITENFAYFCLHCTGIFSLGNMKRFIFFRDVRQPAYCGEERQ